VAGLWPARARPDGRAAGFVIRFIRFIRVIRVIRVFRGSQALRT
jgi:hypothetical protein